MNKCEYCDDFGHQYGFCEGYGLRTYFHTLCYEHYRLYRDLWRIHSGWCELAMLTMVARESNDNSLSNS